MITLTNLVTKISAEHVESRRKSFPLELEMAESFQHNFESATLRVDEATAEDGRVFKNVRMGGFNTSWFEGDEHFLSNGTFAISVTGVLKSIEANFSEK